MRDPRLLDALLSSPTTVLVGTDLEGTINAWSAGAEALYGWTAQEVLGRPLTLLVPPDRVHELDARRRLREGEALEPYETVRLHRDGTLVPVEVHLVAVHDEGGRPCGVVALHRDLRRARTAEVALRASREELRARFAGSPLPQSLVDLSGRLLGVNPALEELVGRSAEELVGRTAMEFYVERDRAQAERNLADLAAGRVSYVRQDRTLVRPDGRHVEVVMTVTLVHDADGQPLLAAAVEDVTALRAAERELAAQAARHDALLETMPVIVFTYDRDGICTSSRGRALEAFGRGQDEAVGSSLLALYADHPQIKHALIESLAGRAATSSLDLGQTSWTCHYRPLLDEQGRVQGGMGVALDVTEQRAAEREVAGNEARLTSLLRHAHDVAMVLDLSGRVVYVSAAARHHFGYDESDLFWREGLTFNHPDDRRLVADAWQRVLRAPGAVERFECRIRHADGSWRWAEHVLTNLVADPAVGGIVANIRETTERRRAEEELRRLALRDALTDLPNRSLLLDRAEHALATARRAGTATGLVLLDVDGMSALNEQLGQAGGDELLRTLAIRLSAAGGPGESLARVGGDAFAVLVEDAGDEAALCARAQVLAEALCAPLVVDGVPVVVALQRGCALSPTSDAGALLAAAERAAAADRRRTPSRRASAPRVLPDTPAVAALRQALREDQLVLHYQPVVDLADGRTTSVEALVRWQHPERGLLPPCEFLPAAEETGLIVDVGAWVLREVCAQLARWRDRSLRVALNLSPRQLVDDGFPALLRGLLQQTGVPADRLVLEVTEVALLDDAVAVDALRALREVGVGLALDDFGTGYSSLTYLKRFPVHTLKVDRSFVAGLGTDRDDEAIVASVVSLARAVGKDVVAEGVETVAQLDALRALGVERAQGFLWARPLPADALEAWLARPQVLPARPAVAATPAPERPQVDEDDEARILVLHEQGASLHTIAAALNAEGRRTPAGPRWTPKTVARVVAAHVQAG